MIIGNPSRSLARDLPVIISKVWASVLGEAEAFAPAVPGVAASAGPIWSGTVTVSGSTQQSISLTTTETCATAMAGHLFQLDHPAAEDVADTLGELANIVGGNVKALLPGSTALSLPVVARGSIASPSSAIENCRAEATWRGHPVLVTIHTLFRRGDTP